MSHEKQNQQPTREPAPDNDTAKGFLEALADDVDTEAGQRKLAVQRAVRSRLAAEPIPSISPEVRARFYAQLRADAGVQQSTRRGRIWRPTMAWTGWAAAAAMALWMLASKPPPSDGPAQPETAHNTLAGANTAAQKNLIPMVKAAFTDFYDRTAQSLPVAAPDLAAFEETLGFPVPPLHATDMQLLSGWLVSIRDQPAAALAYQWRNRIIIQYVVPEELFWRQPEVREAIDSSGRYLVSREQSAVVGWPVERAGVLLVGEAPVEELSKLYVGS